MDSNPDSEERDIGAGVKDTVKQVRTVARRQGQRLNTSMDNVQRQLMSYGSQIQDMLGNYQADIDDYKFSIEKKGDGLSIDVALKATIAPKAAVAADIPP